MKITRRELLAWLGAGAGSILAAPRPAGSATFETFPGYPGSFGVLHDITRCIGCRKCEAACNAVNDLPPPDKLFDDLSVLEQHRRTTAKALTVVNRYRPEKGAPPVFVKMQCNHCMEPACASACFVKALRKDKTGAVVYDASLCVGCRYCMIACPFYIPAYEYNKPFTPRVMKCTMCYPRIIKGKVPGCVEACPKEALIFDTRDSLLVFARQRILRYPNRYIDHIYGEKEMGGLGWLYLSGYPFSRLGMLEDLGTVPASYYTAGPLAVVPVVVALWTVFLTGMYGISKRKEKIALEEKKAAVDAARREADAAMQEKIAQLRKKAEKEKAAAIEAAVKNALKEASSVGPDDGSMGTAKPTSDKTDSGKE